MWSLLFTSVIPEHLNHIGNFFWREAQSFCLTDHITKPFLILLQTAFQKNALVYFIYKEPFALL